MTKALLFSLTEAERVLLAETEKDAMAELDEDELLELHTRIRRARTKYVKLYRRQASAGVAERGGRGLNYPKNQRNRDKAELFELALARVSRQVEMAAKQAAAALKADRLAAARDGGNTGPDSGQASATTTRSNDPNRSRAVKTTGGLKKDASTRSMGSRRQAKRDSR